MNKPLFDLVNGDNWPKAVPDFLLCDPFSEESKIDRAKGMAASYWFGDAKGKKILDFGCGQHHLVSELNEIGFKAFGYDIVKNWSDGLPLTNSLEEAKSWGPFDEIFVYDVIDHSQNPVQLIKDIKSLSNEKTIVKVRSHPWSSRHGGHVYHKINKAFVHLVFSENELLELGVDQSILRMMPVQKVALNPKKIYTDWFENVGVSSLKIGATRSDLEKFFTTTDLVKDRIDSNLGYDIGTKDGRWFVTQDFNDIEVKFNA